MSSVAELADSGDAAEQPRRVVHGELFVMNGTVCDADNIIGDFLHIARTMELAFKNDPIERYMVDPNSVSPRTQPHRIETESPYLRVTTRPGFSGCIAWWTRMAL